ncbi:50S ribosomal protein L22 [Mobiluncus mulieris]|uniref:50S ribosomal protein L22 n=1 Tax=Mobiluncus mulieris TaxID=2052 RepID=UPI00242B4A10|nr:50S ribosomal protein L22 [Mobiluncus mulieris]
MKATAHSRYVRVTPQKARRVIREVRGLPANRALDVLKFAPQKPAVPIRKTLVSALANAEQAARREGKSFDADTMFVIEAYVNEGPTMKRFRARAQGRGARILKRTSHLTVVVGDAADKRELESAQKPVVPPKTGRAAGEVSKAKVKAAKTEEQPASKPRTSGAKSESKPAAKSTAAKSSKPAASTKKATESKSAPKEKSAAKDKEAATKSPTKKAAAKPAAKSVDTEKGAK